MNTGEKIKYFRNMGDIAQECLGNFRNMNMVFVIRSQTNSLS